MKNRKHYIVIENPNKTFNWDTYIVVPEGIEYNNNKYYSSAKTSEEAQAIADRYNSTYYLSDYSEDELMDYFKSIDFKPLEDAIDNYLGVKLTYKAEHKKHRDNWGISFSAEENLCDLIPAFGLMFADVRIADFGACVACNKQTGKLYCNVNVHYSYKHFDRGSNGCELAWCHYEDGKWDIPFTRDEYKNID